jgi:hypothetical protein
MATGVLMFDPHDGIRWWSSIARTGWPNVARLIETICNLPMDFRSHFNTTVFRIIHEVPVGGIWVSPDHLGALELPWLQLQSVPVVDV